MNRYLFAVLICAFSIFSASHATAAEPLDVSLVQLLATPSTYHKKTVRVVAFLSFNFESNVLYLHREDFTHLIFKNGIWIDVQEQLKSNAENLNNKYVLAVGTFDMNFRGHKDVYSASLRKIKRLEPWLNPPQNGEQKPLVQSENKAPN
jgi:hypothetical protein